MAKTKKVTKTNKTGAAPAPQQETVKSGGITDNEFRANVQHRWIEFVAEARCYVEGIYLEATQTVTFSPAAAYRQRKNKTIRSTMEITWPNLTEHQVKDLAEGDPKVGAAPKDFTLVKQ